MVILHTFLALAAGFAVIALLVIAMTASLTRLVPSWSNAEGEPQLGYIVVNLGYSLIAGAAGGYVTAFAAAANPLVHVLVLALTVLALTGMSAIQQRGKQPIWYQLSLVAISPFGVLAGGLMRLRVLGIL